MRDEEDTYRSALKSELKVLKDTIDDNRKDSKIQLDRIETQTVKTNGRVTKLEQWQSYVVGFCACITILLLPILAILANRVI